MGGEQAGQLGMVILRDEDQRPVEIVSCDHDVF
jgi:hypothetical protein